MRILPLAAPLGATVQGIDPASALAPAGAHALRAALDTHLLLLFHRQPGSAPLSPAQLLAFAGHFGVPARHGIVPGLAGHECITEIRKEAGDSQNYGGTWHTDLSFLACPPVATVLQAQELPASGGDTLWSNQYLAYDSLAPRLRARVDALSAEHASHLAFGGIAHDAIATLHPLAPLHPRSGRRHLFANPVSIVRLLAGGVAVDDGEALLTSLVRHAAQERFQYRHRWAAGDILVWDNRSTMHMAINDYAGQRRVMHRVALTAMDERAAAPGAQP